MPVLTAEESEVLAAISSGWPRLVGEESGWLQDEVSVPEDILALGRRYLVHLFQSLQEGSVGDLAAHLRATIQELLTEARADFYRASSALMVAHDLLRRRAMVQQGDGTQQSAVLRAVGRIAECAQVILAELALAEREATLAEERERLRVARAHSQTLRHVNQRLNRANSTAEVLHALAEPAIEAGADVATLLYVDTDPDGQPIWAEVAATWQREGSPSFPPGSRFYLPNFPSTSRLANHLEELFVVDRVADDHRLDDSLREMLCEEGIQTLVLIPLSRPGHWIGFILFGWTELHSFTEPELEIYRALITRASSAVENRRLLVQTQQALDSIQRSERLLRSVIDTTPDWIFIKDRQHRFQLVNRSYAAAFHREPEDFVGKDNLEMGWPEELVKGNPKKGIRGIWTDDREVLDTGRTKLIRDELVAVNGELRVFNTLKIPLRDAEGRVWGLLGFARDITELKRAEEELEKYRAQLEQLVEQRTAQLIEVNEQLQREIIERRQAEARIQQNERFLQAVFDGIQDGISVLDRDLNILRVNQAMERWYAHMVPLAGRKCYEAYHLRSEPCEVCPTLRAMASGTPQMGEVPLTRPGHSGGWLELYAFPTFDDQGQPSGVIEYVRDITERRRMEQYALRAERLAAMGRLAAALAHEINNPLHAIANSLELVLDFPLTKKRQRVYLDAVRREIERLKTLSGRILDFARPPQLERQLTDVAEVVGHALTLAEKQLQSSHIEVSVDLPADLPFVLASGDHLAQVFLNLIINAAEEMPEGGTLRISAQQVGKMVELTFTDSGPGIAPEEISLIFEPFYTTKEDGTGLGLAISYSIIQQYGGTITAANAPEGGAVFTVSLPVGQA